MQTYAFVKTSFPTVLSKLIYSSGHHFHKFYQLYLFIIHHSTKIRIKVTFLWVAFLCTFLVLKLPFVYLKVYNKAQHIIASRISSLCTSWLMCNIAFGLKGTLTYPMLSGFLKGAVFKGGCIPCTSLGRGISSQ